ncbi:unnamed protein product [Microthlaspi erraticum]|uniref:Uncharacterized protein n=1 Tax=Microthlaspi erraticum TaxID=1685480 RepID=A0A6D2JPB6_9BRAS|nr:unnamed protein product [Microthlaspi erraticum]
MQVQQSCPPGPFSIRFSLPGPVDPRLFSPRFQPCGLLEVVVVKLGFGCEMDQTQTRYSVFALDAARIQWYHSKAIIVAGMGLFTEAYNLFCIAPIMKMISQTYYHKDSIRTALLSQLPTPSLSSEPPWATELDAVESTISVFSSWFSVPSFWCNDRNSLNMGWI